MTPHLLKISWSFLCVQHLTFEIRSVFIMEVSISVGADVCDEEYSE